MSSDPTSTPVIHSAVNVPATEGAAAPAAETPRGPLAVGRRSSGPASPPAPNRGGRSDQQRGQNPRKPRQVGASEGAAPATGAEGEVAAEKPDDGTFDKPRKPKFDQGPKPPVPVPNRRGPLPDDLQAEIDAALGGLSLDAIVAAGTKGKQEQQPGIESDTHLRAQVVNVHGDNVFFALGGKNQGVCSVRQFKAPPAEGDMVDVTVTSFNAEDSLYEVTIAGGSIVAGDFADITEGALVEAKITGANTGGLECTVGSARGFIPGGQVSLYRVENLGDFVGQKMVCVVTEANQRRGNLVLSRRAVLEREKESSKKEMMAKLQPGDLHEGVVRKIHDFGAFVDLGGVDGLIHISQLSWERVKHPSEILAEGQKIRVRVEKIDAATGKISLSLKNPEEHPWTGIELRFPVGTIIKGAVTRLAQFGAFVRVAPGVEGLIHISELAHHRVYAVQNVVKEGDEVETKVISVDAEQQRMSLSLKATLQKAVKDDKKPAVEEVEEPLRPLAVPKRSGPLKGGAGKSSGGDQFGLRW